MINLPYTCGRSLSIAPGVLRPEQDLGIKSLPAKLVELSTYKAPLTALGTLGTLMPEASCITLGPSDARHQRLRQIPGLLLLEPST